MTTTLVDRIWDGWTSPVDEVVEAAEQLLKRRTGAAVTLVDAVDLGGSGSSVVLRVRVAENPFSLPRTLVLKQVREESLNGNEGFRREVVSYQFATSLTAANRPGPELIAHDLDARLLVLSDLGDAPAMGELLARKDEKDVTHSLMALTQALGQMHSNTYGREDDFGALLHRASGSGGADPLFGQVDQALAELPQLLLDRLGVTVLPEIVMTVAAAGRVFGEGGFRAFSTADLCPDNILVNEEGVQFLDYEWGGFRDATLDISYALASFPGCRCALDLSQLQVEAMVESWRAEVVGVFPQLRDDSLLYSRLLEELLVWLWLSTWLHLDKEQPGSHALSVNSREALRRRWRVLANFADSLDAERLEEHALEVLAALQE
ncbi:hypothetical protein [Tomitella biformata]|uniref:hypothetical protein n=1 Tax=Tomitella biformata TaxID=630403 RepID=UPI00056E048D|nr:hypothetical protein [Tomitella biformata]